MGIMNILTRGVEMMFNPQKFENPGHAIADAVGVNHEQIGGQLMSGSGLASLGALIPTPGPTVPGANLASDITTML